MDEAKRNEIIMTITVQILIRRGTSKLTPDGQNSHRARETRAILTCYTFMTVYFYIYLRRTKSFLMRANTAAGRPAQGLRG